MKTRPRFAPRLLSNLAIVAVLLLLAAPLCADTPAGFQFAGGPVEETGVPGIYEWRYLDKVGDTFYDKIALHRIARGPRVEQHRAITVLYLPGTNMNGDITLTNPRYSFPVYLATQGADVWTMDYRTHFVPPTVTPVAISDVMKRWTNEAFATDVATAAAFVMSQTGSQKLFVAGFSRGVLFAYLYAAMHPDQVAGIIALDGFIPRAPFATPSSDRVVDDLAGKNLTWDARQRLMQMVIDNPSGPAPIPKYKTAAENLEHVVYDSKEFGAKGGLANPFGGYSDPRVLARLLIGYDRWWPAVQDYENPFTPELRENLRLSSIPVIAFSSSNIAPDWPAWVVESAHSTGASADVTVRVFKGWGHLDVLCGTQAEAQVFAPTMSWLRRHQK
jgi:pimeloyl-ACP methyl ester carboxylesterase